MTTLSCTQVRDYIRQVLHSRSAVPLDSALVAHIVGCSLCQGALVLMQASLTSTTSSSAPIACAECQRLLAAFIDVEASEGTAAALREYPQVGAHLWACADCAEIYLLTLGFIAAERDGEIGSPPFLPTMPRLLPTIHLRRPFLNAALPVPLARRAITRGDDDGAQVLYAEQLEQHHVYLSMLRQADDHCTLIASTTPAVRGRLRLRLGSYTAAAQFDTTGEARLAGLPPALLDAPAGPDLLIELELA